MAIYYQPELSFPEAEVAAEQLPTERDEPTNAYAELGGNISELTHDQQIALGRIGLGGPDAIAATVRVDDIEENSELYGLTGPVRLSDEDKAKLHDNITAARRSMMPAIYAGLLEKARRPDGTVSAGSVLALARVKEDRRRKNRGAA